MLVLLRMLVLVLLAAAQLVLQLLVLVLVLQVLLVQVLVLVLLVCGAASEGCGIIRILSRQRFEKCPHLQFNFQHLPFISILPAVLCAKKM